MEDFLSSIKGGPEVVALVVAIASLVSVFVPDSKMPSWLAKIINTAALNFGRAKNDPSVN